MNDATQASVSARGADAWRTLVQAAALGLAVGLLAYASLWVPQDFGRVAPIWIANALPLVAVLRSRPGRWWIWVVAGFVGNAAADLAIQHTFATAVALAGSNVVEVLIAGLGLRRVLPRGFNPGRMAHLALGVAFCLAGAAASAVLASAWLGLLNDRDVMGQLAIWTLADTLGLIIPTPCLLILADWRRYRAERPPTLGGLLLLTAVLAVEVGVFAQDRYPLLFLVAAAAVVAAINLEMIGAAIAVLATAALAVGFTFVGRGPIALESTGWTGTLILLQAFVAVCCGLTLQVAAMQEQRRVSARRLREALNEAEQAAQVKAEFLANMSHEIRTPLTSILGFASLLAGKDLGEEADRYATRVLGASRNLLALVNDVLDFSRLEAGRLEIKPNAGSPEECGRDAVELFAPQAAEKGLSIAFEAEGLPPHATADFDRVRQVLMNLVGNAVKFTPAGSVQVRGAYEAGLLRYRISDTGPGLDADAQARLFQRFSQVDASVSRAHGGSGLGLAISRGLVEAMGGRIGVESRPGEGSTFWFEVPAPLAEAEAEAGAASLDIAAFAGLKLLLVDDNAANRELIRSLMTPLGVTLTMADGGQAAIDLAQMQEFELILMDLRMPGVDGWTAARAIRAGDGRNRETPMLAFSADIGVDDDAALAVFEGVVPKPIEMMGLLAAIAHWAGRKATPSAEASSARG
jgi:signal transduction histidine kinase/ActR/RegA family two-component response regulator